MTPLELFQANTQRIDALRALYDYLVNVTTGALPVDDLLRAELVLLVSALDHYVHEKTRIEMLETVDGRRFPTEAFSRFGVSLSVALVSDPQQRRSMFDAEIRNKHGHLSFQRADAIADAIRLISSIELWNRLSDKFARPAKQLKDELNLIVGRRNQIAHEADLDPSYPGTRWPIDPQLVSDAKVTIVALVEAIDVLI